METVTGRVVRLERLTNTVNGNPRYDVLLDKGDGQPVAGMFRTSSDAAIAYEIGNPEFRREPHTFALTRAGRISHEVKVDRWWIA